MPHHAGEENKLLLMTHSSCSLWPQLVSVFGLDHCLLPMHLVAHTLVLTDATRSLSGSDGLPEVMDDFPTLPKAAVCGIEVLKHSEVKRPFNDI